ncbi:uncharacterized protein F5147DRAFT_805761 [Suillus discolor]|uniref:Heterokaryon incompatibility domain-containing protein n=1 Tax=Suillus discolor TaxID=1912936 RepID=A0A9P7F370_9AGAM|nr:uncharacterized protein F5147DRAFT_805761 [Suillus discolor]KAG2105530.1 hypothetical protein F5147DRAFT_805761 [Suillus discolor]
MLGHQHSSLQLAHYAYLHVQLGIKTLDGARHDEAADYFTAALNRRDLSSKSNIHEIYEDLVVEYICPSEAEDVIRRAVWIELSNAPLCLLNTSTGLLCDRAAQLNSFKTTPEYKELLSSITKRSDLRMERIKEVVAMHFRCVLLSHRWEETEALLHDIQDKVMYELNGLGGIAWMDTCCIDKSNNVELEEPVNFMFVWYRHSTLTTIHLSDVPPSSQSGALASSVWNERGWAFQKFVAPKVVIFYQKDWSLYLDDRSPNHKRSPAIMKELEGATGIGAQALISFHPGMRGAREKLQWASRCVTTMQEDIMYSYL